MIARHEGKTDIWSQLAAPLPAGVIAWRQDGKPTQRDGKYFARFVCYIEANTVRERLDSVVPGEWDLTLELLPTLDGATEDAACSFKVRLQVLGVIREDVGTGKDYKQGSTDAFKRAAVRFGIAHELYAYEQNWVQVDGDGKYAKPVEDPATAYARRWGRPASVTAAAAAQNASDLPPRAERPAPSPAAPAPAAPPATDGDSPSCPKCDGRMWDNRLSKKNPKAPNFKCRDRSCDGVVWPEKAGATPRRSVSAAAYDNATRGSDEYEDIPLEEPDDNEPPF